MNPTFFDPLFIFGAVYAIIIPVIAVVWLYAKSAKEERKKIVLFALVLLPVTYIVAYIAGRIYPNPRPFVSEGIISLIAHAATNGFPSDHTLLSAVLAVLVTPFSKRLALWLGLVAVFVGLSRVYVGVHHLVDIVGGLIIPALVGWVVWKFWMERKSS